VTSRSTRIPISEPAAKAACLRRGRRTAKVTPAAAAAMPGA
jgi:hypothetical protein